MSGAPTVGVVITTYNRGLEYLPRLLRSLEGQTHSDMRITVVAELEAKLRTFLSQLVFTV